MTGFGAADGTVGGTRVSIEVRSVNHRFFNPSVKLPGELSRWESEVREALRRGVARGHVTVTARIDRQRAEETRIDEARFGAYAAQIRRLIERFGLDGGVDAASILRLPDVIAGSDDVLAGTATELVEIVDRAVAALDAMRTAEGARLGRYLNERLLVIERAVERIAARAPQRLIEQRDRLRATIEELAAGVAVDDQRVAQEIAILADRLDVSEEVSRFHSHLDAFRGTLSVAPPDGVGKRLGFLLQELLREANTTGSKASDSAILQDVISIKEELERIREQVENLE
ncbi:MAG TPA: YicC/YloC family endoribonuclease [Gemmatimonadaceae bacterium]|nr:YicC/YloC family endoribonuclease [Gemmatimonadaceae bacterium]